MRAGEGRDYPGFPELRRVSVARCLVIGVRPRPSQRGSREDWCQGAALEQFHPVPRDGGVARRPGRRARGRGRVSRERRGRGEGAGLRLGQGWAPRVAF